MKSDQADLLISIKLDGGESTGTLKDFFSIVKSEEDPKPNAKS